MLQLISRLVSIPNRDYLELQCLLENFVLLCQRVSIPNRDYLELQFDDAAAASDTGNAFQSLIGII